MSAMEALELLDQLVDESDPDVDFPNSYHAYQTAEGIRRAHPDKGRAGDPPPADTQPPMGPRPAGGVTAPLAPRLVPPRGVAARPGEGPGAVWGAPGERGPICIAPRLGVGPHRRCGEGAGRGTRAPPLGTPVAPLRSGPWWGTPSPWAARCRSPWSSGTPPSMTTPTPETPCTGESGPPGSVPGGAMGHRAPQPTWQSGAEGGVQPRASHPAPSPAPSTGCTSLAAAWRTSSCPGDTTVRAGGAGWGPLLRAWPFAPQHAGWLGLARFAWGSSFWGARPAWGCSPGPAHTPSLPRVHVQSHEVQPLRPAQGGEGRGGGGPWGRDPPWGGWADTSPCPPRRSTWCGSTPSTPGTRTGTTSTSAPRRTSACCPGSRSSSVWLGDFGGLC